MKLFFVFVMAMVPCMAIYAQHGDLAGMEKRMAAGMATNDIETVASDNFKIHFYQCWWTVDPNVDYINGKITAHFIIAQQTDNIVFDLTHVLTVDSVMQRDTALLFMQSQDESLMLQFNKTYNVGDEDSITIYYQGVPPSADNRGFVQSTHNGAPIIWTLSEPYGAKDWWPCRNGLDDKADSIDVHITYPSQYVGTTNGVWQGNTTNNGITSTFFKHRYPIASYLVAIAVSNYSMLYDTVQLGVDTIPVISYIYPESLSDFEARTPLMLNGMKIYYNLFGAYPFMKEKYGQTQFGYSGGMEHQTNSFVGSTGENLMVHELAHQWFGDKVTCGSWQDIWLNEGFAVYLADMLYTQALGSVYYGILVNVDLASIVSQPNGSVWVDDTTTFERIFDERLTYDKGAFLLRMLHWTLGDSAFFNGVRSYLNDPELVYSFARTIDLQHHLEQAGNVDLTYFFQQWFYGQGYPSITVKWQQNINNYAQVNITQVTSDTSVKFFKVPLALTFKNSTQTKTFVVNDSINNLNIPLDIGFAADTVLIDTAQEIISANNTSIKLTEGSNANVISVYPNPFVGTLTLDIKNPTQQRWQIIMYNVAGQKILTNTFTTSGGDIVTQQPLPLYLAKGIYFLKIDAGSVHVIKKLVKG